MYHSNNTIVRSCVNYAVVDVNSSGFNMFIEIQEICTIIQWLCTDTYYMNKLYNNNNVNNYIHNCCQTPKITNDKVEAVQLIYLSIDTKSRQQ